MERIKRFLVVFTPLVILLTGIVGVIYYVETNLTGSIIFNETYSLIKSLQYDSFIIAKKELFIKLFYLYIVLLSIAIVGSFIYMRLFMTRRKSQEWLRKLSQAVQQSPSMVIITDNRGYIEYVNPSFLKITDYNLKELIGTTLAMFDIHGKPLEISAQIIETIKTDGSWRGEFKIQKKNGEFYLLSSTISSIKDNNEEITHYVFVCENITQARLTEEKMTRLAMATESTADGIIITDPDGKIEYMNPAMKAITGWRNEETIGKDLSIIQSGLMSKDYFLQLSEKHHIPGVEQIIMAEEFYADMWKVLQKGKAWKGQLLGRRMGVVEDLSPEYSELPDPSMYWAQSTITPIFDKSGAILGYVVMQRDVTKEVLRKEKINIQKEELHERIAEISRLRELDETHLIALNMANEHLKMAMEEAYNAYRAKDEFLANVSHELRTPIIGISGMIDMLLETELTEEQRDFVGLTRLSSDTLLTLINDILDFSKIEAGGIELETLPFNLTNLVKNTVKSLFYRAKEKGLNISEFISPKVPQMVNGDFTRLRQILLNLIGNAIKFTESGAVKLYIDLEDINEEKVVLHFSVIDTGIGISDENQKRIFKAFTQADGSTSRKYGGTGLGLAIASQLIEKMNGKIWVQSNIGQGSTFHFTGEFGTRRDEGIKIDASQCLIDDVINIEEHKLIEGINVLIVEDNIVNQKFAKSLLQKKKYIVTIANNGKEALKILNNRHFDIILMDIQMPEMDGWETTVAIREKEKGSDKHIPIIAVTANTSKSDKDKCADSGMDDYLQRPIKAKRLYETIERLLNNKCSYQVAFNRITVLAASSTPQRTEQYASVVSSLPPCSTSERNLVSPQIKEKQETVVVTIENKNVFDKHAALESIDGDTDLFRDMIELFLAKSPDLLDTILKSIEAGDHLQIERSAHALKGSVSHFFASSVYEAVLELEELGRNNGDIMTAMELFSVLQQKMIQLREVMTLQVDI